MALEVLDKAAEKLEAVKRDLKTATDAVANFAGKEPSERAKLELARDEQLVVHRRRISATKSQRIYPTS
jgi:hypothetical protein